MDDERMVVQLPEVDRETFEKGLADMDAIAAQMERSALKDRIIAVLAEMRSRLNQK
jgi:hypothetical protein